MLKLRAATAWLCSSSPSSGIGQPAAESGRLERVEPAEAEGGQFLGHRVGPDGQRAPVGGGLDRGVAEALPGRGQHNGVTRAVSIGNGAPTTGLTEEDRAAGVGDHAGEFGSVPVLGRPEQPVDAADRLGEGQGGRHVLAFERPGWLEEEPIGVRQVKSTPHPDAVARHGIRGRTCCRAC